MLVCCDTSFLYALYGRDAHTAGAVATLVQLAAPVTISGLNAFELTNALYHARWRGLIDEPDLAARFAEFAASQARRRILVADCDFAAVTLEAERLAARWTRTHGNRAFDVLHVAVALHLGATTFLTFDARQQALAAAEGLAISI